MILCKTGCDVSQNNGLEEQKPFNGLPSQLLPMVSNIYLLFLARVAISTSQ